MIRASKADIPEIVAFLNTRAERAMFPLSNLHNHGLDGDHDNAVSVWISRRENANTVSDVLSVTRAGMVMPCLPSRNYMRVTALLSGRDIIGIIGPRDDVRGLENALAMQDAPRNLNRDEPHFALSMEQLIIPDGPGRLHPLTDAPKDTILDWMQNYQVEALHTPAAQAMNRATESYTRYVTSQSHMVLMAQGEPVAMTGFNAQLSDIVQVGGVYTPPAHRGRGHARRAVALHLAQTAQNGVTRGTLFSASDAAARAYQSIGFNRIGDWTLLLFNGAQRVADA